MKRKGQDNQKYGGKRKAEVYGSRRSDSKFLTKLEKKEARALDLTDPIGVIFRKTKDKEDLCYSGLIYASLDTRDKSKYCEFHRDYGHITDNSRNLIYELERLIKQGHLKDFQRMGRQKDPSPSQGRDHNLRRDDDRRDGGEQRKRGSIILVVHAESEEDGRSNKARKRSVRELKEAASVSRARTAQDDEEISFSERDAMRVRSPHGDILVISTTIGNFEVRRLLVDTGCSTNIIFLSTLNKMGIEKRKIEPSRSVMVGFNGEKSEAEGKIKLPMTTGDDRDNRTVMTEFQVLGTPSPYNAILGRAWIHDMRASPRPTTSA